MTEDLDPNLLAHQYLYVPWVDGEDMLGLGEALAQHVAGHFKRRPTVLTATRASVSTRLYLSKQVVVTERSGFVPDDTVVIAWCPTRKVMQKVYDRNSIVVLIEWPSDSFEAWARLVGAYNVVTGDVMDARLNDVALEALKGVMWEGYNGWDSDTARTLTLARLQELADAGGYDRSIVAQYAEMHGGLHSIDRLKKILDAFEAGAR